MLDIRTLCLGVLSHKDATGYEIKKLFQEGALCPFLEASFGSIYPALTRLTEEGLVSCRQEVQEKRPDKKVYSITCKGIEAFKSALLTFPEEDKFRSDFMFMSIFADLIPVEHLRQVIDRYIDQRKQQAALIVDKIAEGNAPPGAQFVVGLCKLTSDLTTRYIEENRHLLEEAALQDDDQKLTPRTDDLLEVISVK